MQSLYLKSYQRTILFHILSKLLFRFRFRSLFSCTFFCLHSSRSVRDDTLHSHKTWHKSRNNHEHCSQIFCNLLHGRTWFMKYGWSSLYYMTFYFFQCHYVVICDVLDLNCWIKPMPDLFTAKLALETRNMFYTQSGGGGEVTPYIYDGVSFRKNNMSVMPVTARYQNDTSKYDLLSHRSSSL
jgi:hypothetical protein